MAAQWLSIKYLISPRGFRLIPVVNHCTPPLVRLVLIMYPLPPQYTMWTKSNSITLPEGSAKKHRKAINFKINMNIINQYYAKVTLNYLMMVTHLYYGILCLKYQ